MSRENNKFKRRERNLSQLSKQELTTKFYALVARMHHLDHILLELDCYIDRYEFFQEIEKIENMQASLLISAMAVNELAKVKDAEVDEYLRTRVHLLAKYV